MNELKNERMVVERWKKAVEAGSCQASYRRKRGYTQTNDDYFVDGVQWADENPADTKWLTLDTKPEDGDMIMVLCEGEHFYISRWRKKLGFMPMGTDIIGDNHTYQPVAWRPMADIINEYLKYGAKNAANPTSNGE